MIDPLVSICIPTFNGEQFIVEAIESAINQSYANLEIVVSDDASKDATIKLIEQFKEKTKIPIRIYHHEPNGIGANWNNCIKHATGEYIKFLFQDDILQLSCIEEMVSLIEKDAKIGLVACKREILVEDSFLNDETKKWILKYSDLQKTLSIPSINNLSIIDSKLFKLKQFFETPTNKIGEPSTYLFKKDLVGIIGYFREDLIQILDYEFCCRVLVKYKIAIIDKKLVKFRLHHKQATNNNKIYDISENIKFDKILYEDLFWYFNLRYKFIYFKKHHSVIKLFLKIKRKLYKIINH